MHLPAVVGLGAVAVLLRLERAVSSLHNTAEDTAALTMIAVV